MRLARPPLLDLALAAALAVLGVAEVAGTSPSPEGFAFAVGLAAPLALRRIVPVVAALAVLGVALIDAIGGGEGGEYLFFTIVVLVALYSLGAYADFQRGLVALAGCLALAWWSVSEGDGGASDFAFAAVVVIAPWIVGRIAGKRLETIRATQARAERAVAEERARIARELHDILAYAVGVMVVQAGAAQEVLERDPRAARSALASIRATGKDALVDLRRMLDLLRVEDAPADIEPQPGLGDLEALAERMRGAGMPVDISIEGEARRVPAGVALTVYRVAQEALTNVLKHSGGAAARLRLVYGSERLELEVADEGRAGAATGDGHGLVGMRERVSVYGGELEAGRAADGGFRVRASMPYR